MAVCMSEGDNMAEVREGSSWLDDIRGAVTRADVRAEPEWVRREAAQCDVAEEFVANRRYLRDVVTPVLIEAASELTSLGKQAEVRTLGGLDGVLGDYVECSLSVHRSGGMRQLNFSAGKDRASIRVWSTARVGTDDYVTRESLDEGTIQGRVVEFVKAVFG